MLFMPASPAARTPTENGAWPTNGRLEAAAARATAAKLSGASQSWTFTASHPARITESTDGAASAGSVDDPLGRGRVLVGAVQHRPDRHESRPNATSRSDVGAPAPQEVPAGRCRPHVANAGDAVCGEQRQQQGVGHRACGHVDVHVPEAGDEILPPPVENPDPGRRIDAAALDRLDSPVPGQDSPVSQVSTAGDVDDGDVGDGYRFGGGGSGLGAGWRGRRGRRER